MAPALQITIPSASTATPKDGKPFTQYRISLQLPLRRHEIGKRYNDFLALHEALVSETGRQPPSPLPGKSWLRRTVNSESYTEERRQGLERYLKSIIETDDAIWRSSSAWRSFLNLPGGTTTNTTANGRPGSSQSAATNTTANGRPGSSQSAAVTDPNQWLDMHRDLKTQIQTARSQLKQREAASTAQAQHSLSAEAKASLVRAATSISQLETGLKAISSASKGDDAGWGGSKRLGEGELRRRRDLVGAAKKEVEGLEAVLKTLASQTAKSSTSSTLASGAAASAQQKEELWKGTAAAKPSGRVLGGPTKETERTRELDNAGVLQLQQQIMQEQDEDVLTLGKSVARMKEMGILINEELELQNEMLNVIDQDVTRVQDKIDVGRRRIKKIH